MKPPSRCPLLMSILGILVTFGVVLCGCTGEPEPAPPAEGLGGTPVTPEAKVPDVGGKPAGTAELPEAPPVSEFAPAADLAAQVETYLDEFDEAVETQEAYDESVEIDKLAKDSNTFILIALALGLHDADNQFKAAAPGMVKAAQQLAAAKDYPAAKAAVEAVKSATASTGGTPADLKWEKVASLKALMEAVPLINTKLKRYVRKGREDRMKKAADDLAGYAAVLAVIAQGSMANAGETKKPEEVEKWHAYCAEMRDASAAVNVAVRTFEKEGTPEAFDATAAVLQDLNTSCDVCHEVFHPDALTATDEQ